MDDVPTEDDALENIDNANINNNENTSPSIGKELYSFLEQISSLLLTLKLTISALIEENKKVDEAGAAIEAERDKFIDPESKSTQSELADYVHKYEAYGKQLRIMTQA